MRSYESFDALNDARRRNAPTSEIEDEIRIFESEPAKTGRRHTLCLQEGFDRTLQGF